MNTPALEVQDASKSFPRADGTTLQAFSRISFSVRRGELVSLIGPSGCGKTTLLECIAGLILPDEGIIHVEGERTAPGRVGYMTQTDVLLPWRTVLDNVIIPLELKSLPLVQARNEGRALLKTFGLKGFETSSPDKLSGGMRQRAALARTYLAKHNILLLDEPFGRLDALTRGEMQAWFLDVWERERKTVLFVTHDVDEAILLSDRVFVLSPRPGTVAEEITISLPRPRMLTDTTLPAFGLLREKILKALNVIK